MKIEIYFHIWLGVIYTYTDGKKDRKVDDSKKTGGELHVSYLKRIPPFLPTQNTDHHTQKAGEPTRRWQARTK